MCFYILVKSLTPPPSQQGPPFKDDRLSSTGAAGRSRPMTMTQLLFLSLLTCLCLSSVFPSIASSFSPSSSMLVAAARPPLNPVQNREFLNARSQVIRRMQKDIPPDTRPRHVVASCEVR